MYIIKGKSLSWNKSFKKKFKLMHSYCIGVDCDEVWPGILLGNGATVKKLKYLRHFKQHGQPQRTAKNTIDIIDTHKKNSF